MRAEAEESGAAGSSSVPDPVASPGGALLDALVLVARHHGRDVSPAALLSGLPVTDGQLRPALMERAAQRADLIARPVARALAEIPNLVLPAILITRDARAVVLMRQDAETGLLDLLEPDFPEPAAGAARLRRVPAAEFATVYSGYAFFVTPASGIGERGGIRAARVSHWFWDTLAAFRANYLHVAIAAFLINVLALAFPLFVMNVYDRVLPNGAIASLVALSIGVIIAFVFDFVLRMVRSRVIDLTSKQIDVTLSARLFAQILGLRLAVRPRSAGVLANQIREFESVREFFTSGTVISATDLAFAVLFIAVMFLIVGPLAVIPLLLLPVVLGIGFLIQRPLDRAVRDVQAEAAARHGILVEAIGGLEMIRALGAENRVQTHWERSVAASARATEAVHHLSTLSLTLTATAQNIASLLVIVWGVFLVLDNQITMGALVAANMLVGRILAPVGNLAAVLTRGVRTLHALRAIDALMALPVERPPGRVFVARQVREGALAFENVRFRYPDAETDALKGVSFAIRPGERVGIVGRIGSGKTTVGKLASGFYEPVEGRILVDGVDLRQYDPADLRAGLGFVMQDCELLHGTLRENITIGRPDARDEEVIAAARLAGVESFARQSPLGYELPIAEGGRSVSGGQRQAIALARALIRKPRILFLDEPTSALDLRSEAEFCERIALMQAGTTLIVSTHRVSLLRIVDRILVFDAGRVVADGPRDEVLNALNARGGAAARKAGAASEGAP
ncbi:MAG: type I secretion system permease/ATPase [Hyphomicrobiales bacterium]|nr:type I secretion system permease/ATPase [Hyphomicrobiales bacterium]